MNSISIRLASFLILLLGATLQAGVQYTFTTLSPFGDGRGAAFGINDSGQVVGWYGDPNSTSSNRGFLWSGGNYTRVDVPGSRDTTPWEINNSGQIVGTHYVSGKDIGFRLSGGAFTPIDRPGATFTWVAGINDSGLMVGSSDPTGAQRGFLLSGSTYTAINMPAAWNARADACGDINNSGEIVGWYNTAVGGRSYGYLLSNGTYTKIDPPGSTWTNPYGINDAGQIVGRWRDSYNVEHGFLLSGGTFTSIDVPGSTRTVIQGINNSGVIVGAYGTGGRPYIPFIATPIPEPASLGVLTLASGLFCLRRRRA